MYCTNCGAPVQDNALFCESCGSALASQRMGNPAQGFQIKEMPLEAWDDPNGVSYGCVQEGQSGQHGQAAAPMGSSAVYPPAGLSAARPADAYDPSIESTDRSLRLAAFVLNLLVTIACGIFLITLAWMIPMTVHSWRIYKGECCNTVAFGVCTLLFCSTVGGILLLCSKKDA